jgi:hypothetical protein
VKKRPPEGSKILNVILSEAKDLAEKHLHKPYAQNDSDLGLNDKGFAKQD